MLLSLWNFLRGFVTIFVTGFSVERFINLATHKGIYIWDVQYDDGGIYMKVSIKAFKQLKECARKTKCKVKITSKTGVPFLAYKYRKRKVLVLGALGFVLALYALSSFVWQIEVLGTGRLVDADVEAFCGEQALFVGAFKYNVNTKTIQKELMGKFPEIAWVNVHIKGTKATVTIKEALKPEVVVDRATPCDIVASKDALIESIVTSAGTPQVKQDDVVHEGDVLVKSEVFIVQDEVPVVTQKVHAAATILGKLYYNINFEVPLTYLEKEFTQREKKEYSVLLFGTVYELPWKKQPFDNFQKNVSRNHLSVGKNYPLPIIILTETYKEFENVEKVRTIEQSKELAERMVTGRIIREFDFSADVLEKQLEFIENSDRIVVESIVTTIENIGVEKIAE